MDFSINNCRPIEIETCLEEASRVLIPHHALRLPERTLELSEVTFTDNFTQLPDAYETYLYNSCKRLADKQCEKGSIYVLR